MPIRSSAEQQARFVFRGTVKKLRASTIGGVKGAERTAVVRVEEVIRAPEALSQYAGQEITVELAGRHKLKAGQQAMFYANGWIFGDSIAVQAIDHPPVEAAHVTMAGIPADPVANLVNHDAKSRFDQAEVVVSAQVVSVNLPTAVTSTALAAAAPGAGERFSEHVPLWRDAVIAIHAVHKGRHASKRAVVRFPASTDVIWHRAPKFQPGQEGFFMLHRGGPKETAKGKWAFAPAADGDGAYTALHPADFQPFDHPGGIRTMIDAAAGARTRQRSGVR